ncbi:MAG TPA: hypothetical protein VN520_02195, partial [Streptomyces sp.]
MRNAAELEEAERPFLKQLKAMRWQHVSGPDLADDERRSLSHTLLTKRLSTAVRRLNRLSTGEPWMD